MSALIDITQGGEHSRRTALFWAVLAAVVLNGCLFALMPVLTTWEVGGQLPPEIIPQVNIVHVQKRIDTKKVESVPKKEPEVKPQSRPIPQQQIAQVPKLSLPFAINPRLPGKPSALRLPPPKTALAFAPVVGDVFSAGELDAPLTVLARTPPLYPLRARQRGIQGWVKVKLHVDENGDVGEVFILESQPEGVFENSVRRCVSGWKFQPGTVEGIPVKAEVETTIKFALE